MNKVLILLGPTGVGKTSVSLLLAKTLASDIISADSMQVYRHMDIGTAKPSSVERRNIDHHMIDIVEPWETYSTGQYIAAVKTIIERLSGQGKIPIVVGGTGLYIKAMTRGIFSGPSADWTLRDELLALNQETKGILYDSLKALDPDAARNITPNDTRRLIRALEVCLKGEAKMTELQRSLTRPLPCEFIKIGITRDRRELYRIIERRVDAMLKGGLIEEARMVIRLISEHNRSHDSGDTAEDKHHDTTRRTDRMFMTLPSMQAIGYKEIIRHLRGEMTLEEAVDLIKKASKRFAKRQFTWFRREENVHWIDITGVEEPRDIFDRIYPVIAGLCDIPELRHA